MAAIRINPQSELHAHHVNMRNNSVTLKSSEGYQQYIIFTQRCGLFLVWSMNGTLGTVTLSNVSGLSFSASGTRNITVTWSSADNLHVMAMSYEAFSIA